MNLDTFSEYEKEMSKIETVKHGDATHIVCRGWGGNRDFGDEIVLNSCHGELNLDDCDFANE